MVCDGEGKFCLPWLCCDSKVCNSILFPVFGVEKSKPWFSGLLGSSPGESLDIGNGVELVTLFFCDVVHGLVESKLFFIGDFGNFFFLVID